MPDILPTVGSDNGPREAVPVVLFSPQGLYAGKLLIDPLGYRHVDLSTTTVYELNDIPGGSSLALIKIEGASIRYRDDGVDPTATVGMPLSPGETLQYDASMGDLRLIAQSTGAVANISFYGPRNA